MEDEHEITLMVAYVYARDSKFENVLNAYMKNLRPVNPYDILDTMGMRNFTSATF